MRYFGGFRALVDLLKFDEGSDPDKSKLESVLIRCIPACLIKGGNYTVLDVDSASTSDTFSRTVSVKASSIAIIVTRILLFLYYKILYVKKKNSSSKSRGK